MRHYEPIDDSDDFDSSIKSEELYPKQTMWLWLTEGKAKFCESHSNCAEFNCERCGCLMCHDCQTPFNQFSQIDYNCCHSCGERNDD